MDNWARACFQFVVIWTSNKPGALQGAFPMTSSTTTIQADVDQALICLVRPHQAEKRARNKELRMTADEEIVGTLKIGWRYLRDGCPQAGHRMWPTFPR